MHVQTGARLVSCSSLHGFVSVRSKKIIIKAEIRNVCPTIESTQSLSLGEQAGQYKALMLLSIDQKLIVIGAEKWMLCNKVF